MQQAHVGHLPLVVVAQPAQLLAVLLGVIVLAQQLHVVQPHRLQLVLQLAVLARQPAVQRAENTIKKDSDYYVGGKNALAPSSGM